VIAAVVDAGGLLAAAYLPLAAGVVLLLLSGVAWTVTLTTLTVATQLSLPQWVQARGVAMYLVVLIGAQALGALVWGLVASHFGLTASLTTAAVLLIGTAVSMVVLPLLPETGIAQPSPSDGHVSRLAAVSSPPGAAAGCGCAPRAHRASRPRRRPACHRARSESGPRGERRGGRPAVRRDRACRPGVAADGGLWATESGSRARR